MSETDESVPAVEDDGPTVTDPEHGLPGDAEPLPDGDAEVAPEPVSEGELVPDDGPEELDENEDDSIIEGDPIEDDAETPTGESETPSD